MSSTFDGGVTTEKLGGWRVYHALGQTGFIRAAGATVEGYQFSTRPRTPPSVLYPAEERAMAASRADKAKAAALAHGHPPQVPSASGGRVLVYRIHVRELRAIRV